MTLKAIDRENVIRADPPVKRLSGLAAIRLASNRRRSSGLPLFAHAQHGVPKSRHP